MCGGSFRLSVRMKKMAQKALLLAAAAAACEFIHFSLNRESVKMGDHETRKMAFFSSIISAAGASLKHIRYFLRILFKPSLAIRIGSYL